MKFSNKVYDTLKYIITKVFPAIEFLWLTLGKIWDFPLVTQIGATLAAIATALGMMLGISSKNYYKDLQNGNN